MTESNIVKEENHRNTSGNIEKYPIMREVIPRDGASGFSPSGVPVAGFRDLMPNYILAFELAPLSPLALCLTFSARLHLPLHPSKVVFTASFCYFILR
jgi:hypothetical protein